MNDSNLRLTDREVAATFTNAAVAEKYSPPMTMLADTGMRVGELKHLTWADIDFENGVVRIRPKDGWKPKTGDIRVIPMTPRVKAMLARLPRQSKWVFTARPSVRYPSGGRQISERRLLEHLKRVLGRLSLVGHLHTFRHSFISAALTRGIPEAIVREWVGHVDRDILGHYTHIADQASKEAMKSLAAGKKAAICPAQPGSKKAQFQHKPKGT